MSLLFSLVFVCLSTIALAQSPVSTPDSELKKMQVFSGYWTYEGQAKPTSAGPGGKFTGEANYEWILSGFALQLSIVEKQAVGTVRMLEIDTYDPANKNFSFNGYDDGGGRYWGVVTVSGNTWTYEGEYVLAGKQIPIRGSEVFTADGMSFTQKHEFSLDGKTWVPEYEATYTKTKPVAKK
jgi:hypothetical protein